MIHGSHPGDSDLGDLYQDVILDHGRKPRNFGRVENPSATAEGFNPLCGDRLTVQVTFDHDRVTDVHFLGAGCAISIASASLMTEVLRGKTKQEAEQIFQSFHDLLTTDKPESAALGKLAVFSGVREYPMRVKCATLAWHAVRAALRNSGEQVTTE
ncbi:MAG TPA: SUF system NifU family Fe-S cluster assembly protein [Bryobacteraceae bacterium]|nr:SUF system NifU family Fe-S cluster assembly protein [Bryobacteraceae bacterium]